MIYNERKFLESLGADDWSDYTVVGVINILKEHGWRIVTFTEAVYNDAEDVKRLIADEL